MKFRLTWQQLADHLTESWDFDTREEALRSAVAHMIESLPNHAHDPDLVKHIVKGVLNEYFEELTMRDWGDECYSIEEFTPKKPKVPSVALLKKRAVAAQKECEEQELRREKRDPGYISQWKK